MTSNGPKYPFDEVARPVCFAHDDPIYSIWAKGSSFLCTSARNFYWVTAAHVVDNHGVNAASVRVFPSDQATISLPFDEQYRIKSNGSADDYKDLLILRINDDEFHAHCDTPLVGQDIECGFLPAEVLTQGCELWIVGYAAENNYIDYDDAKVHHTRTVMRAIYQGDNHFDFCHVAKIESSIVLSSFDGLSGSPVFYFMTARKGGNEIQEAVLVGMLLRGGAESDLVHFVSAGVIRRAIELTIA
ncbi:hypothetical protein [Pseudoduganella sp.]|uniref:hypothetical protein n=1 Tax=Pseudoduganella sp. TaxID=1880898 RepID=UPI0035AF0B71